MDREIPTASRFIDRKMQEFRDKKHRQTLNQIKRKNHLLSSESFYKEPNKNPRYNALVAESKNLQIEKQNILLFNKIANILREKPKGLASRSYAQSVEAAALKQKKKREKLRTENDLFERRISEQKPTIQNKELFKDRMKNLKYLKFIGRYPYEGRKTQISEITDNIPSVRSMRSVSEYQLNEELELYQKKSEGLLIKIKKMSNCYYVFIVEEREGGKEYRYTMDRSTFEDQHSKCGYSYEQLVGRLRLVKNEKMIFQYQ